MPSFAAMHTASLSAVKPKRRNWSRSNVLTVIGVVAGLAVIPIVAILVPGGIAPGRQEFFRASAEDLDSHDRSCFTEPNQVIPAGSSVCVLLTGTWLDGSGPGGVMDRDATAIWTQQAHPPFMVLTSPRAYRESMVFHEGTDFVICVQPPLGAERNSNVTARMRIDIVRRSSISCAAETRR